MRILTIVLFISLLIIGVVTASGPRVTHDSEVIHLALAGGGNTGA